MAAIGGGGDETPCQEEERNEAKQRRQRAAVDLAGARRSWARSSSAMQIARGELGLGFRPRGGESEGTAGPGRAGSVKPPGWTDRWA
jgi:hypothetical protein